jgi:hypothetical protein
MLSSLAAMSLCSGISGEQPAKVRLMKESKAVKVFFWLILNMVLAGLSV